MLRCIPVALMLDEPNGRKHATTQVAPSLDSDPKMAEITPRNIERKHKVPPGNQEISASAAQLANQLLL